MADFCTLCGYDDIDIDKLYNELIKPTLTEDIKTLPTDDYYISVNVGGICEHCGITNFNINNKYEVWGVYFKEPNHQFGKVNPETSELVIFEDDPKYNKQRDSIKRELTQIKIDLQLITELGFENYKKLFNMKITNKYVFFWGEHPSQWYPSPMTIDGVEYNCCEQYMMHMKALHFGDVETAEEVMVTKHASDQKKLGRKVKNFDKNSWDKVNLQIVYKGNYAKYTQNEELKQLLEFDDNF
jgi:predicted NAD-dependent protein-ADP-ribosyltransferase YbiA (DUF1768 family)